MGAALQQFMNRFNEFKMLPTGEAFTIRVTDQEATAAAEEYLTENRAQVKQLLQKSTGMGLSVEKPSIGFQNDKILLSVMGDMGFLKAKASLAADVRWNDGLVVIVRSVDLPFISVSPQKLNSVVENPLRQLTEKVEEYAEIRSFKLMDGFAVLEAMRK